MMKMRTMRVLAGVSACALGLGAMGCQQQGGTVGPGVAANDPIPNELYPKVTVEHAARPFVLIPYDAVVVDEADGTRPLRVTVPVRSTADDQFALQYQFSWFDGGGRPISESGWTMIAMEPGLQRVLSSNAVSQRAEDWRLELRLSR